MLEKEERREQMYFGTANTACKQIAQLGPGHSHASDARENSQQAVAESTGPRDVGAFWGTGE